MKSAEEVSVCSAKSCSGATSRTKLGKGNTNCQQRPPEITESSEELGRVCISTNSKLTRGSEVKEKSVVAKSSRYYMAAMLS